MHNQYDFIVTSIHHVMERETTNGWSFNAGVRNEHLIAINLGGIGYYDVVGEAIEIHENDVVLFPPQNVRKCTTDEFKPWHFISIGFTLKHTDGSDYILNDIPMVIRNVHHQVKDNFKRISRAWNDKPKAYDAMCRAYIQNILCQLIQINDAVTYNTNHYAKIENVKKYINDNFTRNMSVDELAEVAGLSQSHFRKIFREIVGMSATQYAIYLRINKAKDLLASGSANVSEAAFQSGFKDIYYFSSMFKKVTGENPSKYLR